MTIGQRIKQRRLELGLSADDVALALGKNRATIYRYESNDIEKLPTTVLEPLAEVLKTTPAHLMGWESPTITGNNLEVVPPPDAMVRIPVIGEVAAGMTCLADMQIIDTMLCDAAMIHTGYDYVYLKVRGDSMEPEMHEGDLVLVRVQDTIESGEYAVVLVDGEDGLVKRIEIDSTHLSLISENPYYPPRRFDREQMNRVRIFGKVISHVRKY